MRACVFVVCVCCVCACACVCTCVCIHVHACAGMCGEREGMKTSVCAFLADDREL